MKQGRPKKRNLSGSNLAQAKNLLRPYMSTRRKLDFSANLQRLRAGYPLAELPELLLFMEGNPALQFPGFGNVLPRDPKRIPDSHYSRLEALSPKRELDLAVARLNFHKPALLAQIEALHGINLALMGNRPGEAQAACEQFTRTWGHSLIIAKKQLLASLLHSNIRGLATTFSSLTNKAEGWAWSLLMKYYYDLSDPSYEVDTVLPTWSSYLKLRGYQRPHILHVLRFEVLGSVANEAELAETVLRYNATSLLDMMIVIWRLSSLGSYPDLDRAFRVNLDSSLRDFLAANFSSTELVVPARYRESPERLHDVDIFRMSTFFDEFGNVARWRTNLTRFFIDYEQPILMFADIEGDDLREASRNLESSFEEFNSSGQGSKSFARRLLGKREDKREQNFAKAWEGTRIFAHRLVGKREPNIATAFSNMLVAADFLRKCDDPGALSEPPLAKLLASAHGLSDVLTNSELKRIGSSLNDVGNALAAFIVAELLFRKARTPDNDLERRAQFMDLIQNRNTTIVTFIEEVSIWSAVTAIFVARLCTRTFIERLYMIVSSVKDVIELRIAVLDWLIVNDARHTVNYKEEIETLRTELANLDVRTDLDSTRVHVDEDALGDWFGATQRALITRYAQTVIAEGPDPKRESILSFYTRLREEGDDPVERAFLLESQIGSDFLLLQIVENTLKAFVSDRLFGLDAYLSRRIRHGTLSGFLLTPLTRIISPYDEAENHSAEVHPDSTEGSESLRGWLDELTTALDIARREIIQIKSDAKPNGLIEATWRTTTGVALLDAAFSNIRLKVFETAGKYDFFPDIYALCWDLIERDLASVRRFLTSDFYKESEIQLRDQWRRLSREKQVVSKEKFNLAAGTFHNRILSVSAWFIRPVFRKEVYKLRTLIDSMFSIIRELEPSGVFREVIAVPDQEEINRGAFEVIGDILFILIGNAVKHGSPNSEIAVSSGKSNEETVTIALCSQVGSSEDFARARERITEAMQFSGREDIASASVTEGFSGIRKVIGVLMKIRGGNVDLRPIFHEATNSVEFEVTMPRRIILAKV